MKSPVLKILSISACFAVLACHGSGDPKAQGPGGPGGMPNMPAKYKTEILSLRDDTLFSSYTASVNGKEDVDIRPQISGTISKTYIDDGAEVKKGTLLFTIDESSYRAALETAVANVKAKEVTVASNELTLESKRSLFDKKIISEYEFKTAENSLLSAKAALAQAKTEEMSARNNLSYTQVRSPVQGVAGIVNYTQGEMVSASMATPFVSISDNSEMRIYFSMTEAQISSLLNQFGSLKKVLDNFPPMQFRFSDGSLYKYTGKLQFVSQIIDKSTGTVTLTALFPNKEKVLLSGASGTVLIPTYKKDCIIIPQAATFEIQDKIFAYKVVIGTAKSVEIKVFGKNNGNDYIVESGLKAGDEIIAEGAGLVREGAKVAK